MKLVNKLLVIAVAITSFANVRADTIEFDLDYSLSLATVGDTREGQGIGGVATFFTDEAFLLGLGDTLIFNILFDRRLQVFEFDDEPLTSTNQYFSFGLDCGRLCPQPNGGFNGTWSSSIEAIGGRANIWSDPITLNWQGGGGGIGWGGQGIQITDSQGSFTGIRWTTTVTSVNEGGPLLLAAFTGVQMGADRIRILPVPEPATLALFGLGLLGFGFARTRR